MLAFIPIHLLYIFLIDKGWENPKEATKQIVCDNCHLANKPIVIEVPQTIFSYTVFETIVLIPHTMQLK